MKQAITESIQKTASILNDGWANILTGLGVANRDKGMAAVSTWVQLREADVDSLYAGNDTAAKIVNMLPEDCFREGYDLKGMTPEQVAKLEEEKTRLNVDARMEEGMKLGRAYGGAALFMVTDDAIDYSLPLDLSKVSNLVSLIPLTRWELNATSEIENDIRNPNFGNPKTYQLSPRGITMASALQRVHHTRLIRFEGHRLAPALFVKNNYWHDSVLGRAYEAIRNFDTAYASASLALQDFRVGVFKLKGLAQLVGNGKDDQVIKRLGYITSAKSVARAIVIDEAESWEEKTTTFTGIPDILEKMKDRVQAAADGIPHTKLWGESPDGMGSTGRSTEVNWYDLVSSRQEQQLRPRLLMLYRVIAAQKKNGIGGLPKDATIEFRPLWQMDEKEKVEMRAKQAETDVKYIDAQVLDPQEVRKARFQEDAYSIETKVEGDAPLPEPEVTPAPQPDPNAPPANPGA